MYSQAWEYKGQPIFTFYSPRISGVCRLDNGNTFICEGNHGRLFEVTQTGDIVWEYTSPFYNFHPQLGDQNNIYRARKYSKDDSRIEKLLENLATRKKLFSSR